MKRLKKQLNTSWVLSKPVNDFRNKRFIVPHTLSVYTHHAESRQPSTVSLYVVQSYIAHYRNEIQTIYILLTFPEYKKFNLYCGY